MLNSATKCFPIEVIIGTKMVVVRTGRRAKIDKRDRFDKRHMGGLGVFGSLERLKKAITIDLSEEYCHFSQRFAGRRIASEQ
jgi:hypothetical protein